VKVAVTGASGLIGSALVPHLRARGDEVVTLVRRAPRAPGEVRWDPQSGDVDLAGLAGTEAVVHLSGAGVGDKRWTPEYKELIRSSRVDSTRTIATAMAALDPLPRVLVSGSAMGVYGDRGDEELTETSPPGTGYFPDVVTAWEAAAAPAVEAGIRVAYTRTSLVMSRHGGAFGRLVPLAKLGLAGPLGSGRQWWSWLTLQDDVRARAFVIDHEISGPVNFCSPQPLRQRDIAAALGRAAHRPAVLPAPAFVLRAVLGEFAGDILASDRLLPTVLTDAGFTFDHPDVDTAARWTLGG
jgi:uncharacterized protein (TIGR01777 family)